MSADARVAEMVGKTGVLFKRERWRIKTVDIGLNYTRRANN